MNSQNTIGLKKISNNSYEVVPGKYSFQACSKRYSMTIGAGIKRAFSNNDIDLEFKRPLVQYIEQFFQKEMKNIFSFDGVEDEFATQFIQNLNIYFAEWWRGEYLSYTKMYCFSQPDYSSLEVLLAKINIKEDSLTNNFQSLSVNLQIKILKAVYSITVAFVKKFLKESGQSHCIDANFGKQIYLDHKVGLKENKARLKAERKPTFLFNNQSFLKIVICFLAIVIVYLTIAFSIKK